MPGDLGADVLLVAAVAAGFIVLVLLSVRVMRWAIVRRHPEIIVASTIVITDQRDDVSAAEVGWRPPLQS